MTPTPNPRTPAPRGGQPRARHAVMAVLAPALALLAACGHHERPQVADALPATPPRPVLTASVTRTGGSGEVSVPGAVHAVRRAALAARISASVTALPYREGERVAEGAVVVRLDDSALRSAVQAAEAAERAAQADLQRVESLLGKGAATPREFDEAASRAAGARSALAGARDNLAYAVLRAPFAGRLASRAANVGDVVSPGTTLVEIEAAGGLEVRATVEAEVAARLQIGARIGAQVDGQAEPLEATLRAISPAADPTTHRFEVKADLPNRPGLRAGLFARLRVPAPVGPERLVVPERALVRRGGLTGVFVVDGTVARLRWVAPGESGPDGVEIRAGVEAGERVVVSPEDLVDGAPILEKR